MATIAEELRNSFPLHAEERFGGISRMPAHLHLMYYQVSWFTIINSYMKKKIQRRFGSRADLHVGYNSHHAATFILLSEESVRIVK